jgi:hypothetical protein
MGAEPARIAGDDSGPERTSQTARPSPFPRYRPTSVSPMVR